MFGVMQMNASGSRALLLSAASMALLAACNDKSLSPIDAGKPRKHDAGPAADAAADGGSVTCPEGAGSGTPCNEPGAHCWTKCSGGFMSQAWCTDGAWSFGKGLWNCGPTTPVPCDDGTGRMNCCPFTPMSGDGCNFGPDTCWTKCSGGFTSQASCSDGNWTLGHGLFPCGADASAASEDDAGGSSACGAGAKRIQASDYHQTCALDSDCVAVGEGDVCSACALACPTAAINKADKNHYTSDVEHAKRAQPAGSVPCHCPDLIPAVLPRRHLPRRCAVR